MCYTKIKKYVYKKDPFRTSCYFCILIIFSHEVVIIFYFKKYKFPNFYSTQKHYDEIVSSCRYIPNQSTIFTSYKKS